MPTIHQSLARELQEMGVCISEFDSDTVVLSNIPLNESRFNKPHTNLLLKRLREGMPYMVCVEADLAYTGHDAGIARMFSGGSKQEAWRVLFMANGPNSAQDAIRQAFAALGLGGDHRTEGKLRGLLLTSMGVSLTQRVSDGKCEQTVGRADEIDDLASTALMLTRTLPVIVGASGIGKTNLVQGVARRLAQRGVEMVAVDLGMALAGKLFPPEQEMILAGLFQEAAICEDLVLAFERIDLIHCDLRFGRSLIANALDAGVRLIGTSPREPRVLTDSESLAGRLEIMRLTEPSPAEVTSILDGLRNRMSEHHHVDIADHAVKACVQASYPLPGCYPAKAIELLDAAAARASLAGSGVVALDDIYAAVSRKTQAPV